MSILPSEIRTRRGAVRAGVVTALCAAVACVPLLTTATGVASAIPKLALSCNGTGLQAISRDEVIARAGVWLSQNVAYNQGSCHADPEYPGHNYRQDCSGYVSMAWGLPRSLVVSTLPSVATELSSWSQLQPGDALVSPDGTTHVVLFDQWTNSAHTTFTVWEESKPGVGTVSRSSGSWLDRYIPYRYNGIISDGGGTRMIGSGAYMDVSSTGQVYAWNSRYLGGSPSGYSGQFTDAKVTPGDNGYWLLDSAGQIYAYGNAPYLGGGAPGHTGDIVAMAATSDSGGYVMLSSTGQVYAYGDAGYYGGSPGGYSGAFVDIEMTPDSRGYWLLDSAGQIYAYGDAGYYGGSPSGFSREIVAMSPTPDGKGYVMVSGTGQVYAYGDAQYLGGSPAGITGEISGISYTPGLATS